MSERLAIAGGRPTIQAELPLYNAVGEDEIAAVEKVMRSGCLSGYYGSWGPQFLGGPVVQQFESAWARRFGVKHAVAVNSATSGLVAAMAAVGVSPGDEVIVPPYSMSATVMAPLAFGGVPVFVDIDADTFTLDLDQVRAAITPKTRTILAVNLFGQPARLHELRRLADERGIFLVEDNAQGPLAAEDGRSAGTIGHVGVFSLNYHKHIHTGEGGVCVTDDDELALKMQLVRNHAENAIEHVKLGSIANMVGHNFRMTEIAAAIGIAQLAKVDERVAARETLARRLSDGIRDLEGFTPPLVRGGCRHVYYAWATRVDEATLGVTREQISRALEAEGFPHGVGYVRPLYRLPVFQRRIAIGRDGFPFGLTTRRYEGPVCPVAERMYARELMLFETCTYEVSEDTAEKLVAALRKVHAGRAHIPAVSASEVR